MENLEWLWGLGAAFAGFSMGMDRHHNLWDLIGPLLMLGAGVYLLIFSHWWLAAPIFFVWFCKLLTR